MKLIPPPHRLLFALTAAVSFAGIFHALPLVNVVADEMYFVGGVLRALAAGSVLPLPGDVPYGTLTFLLNYVLQLPFLAAGFVITGFNLGALRELLSASPEVAYVVPRVASALVATLFAFFYERFLREEGVSLRGRAAALSVLFLTILPLTIFHTGKMWVLSFCLASAALLYAYRALRLRHDPGNPRLKRALYLSVPLAALAAANFLFAGIVLAVVPVLVYLLRTSRIALAALFKACLAAAGVFLLALLYNGANMLSLVALVFTEYHPLDAETVVFQIGFFHSLGLHFYQLLAAFPVALAALLIAARRGAFGNRLLLHVSLAASAAYLLALSFLATWYDDPGSYLRYFFPFAFLFSMALAAVDWERLRSAFWGLLVAQGVAGGITLMLLIAPTTYNGARDYLTTMPSGPRTLLYEDVVEMDLPLDSLSASLLRDEFCGSRCAYALEKEASAAGLVHISSQSEPSRVDTDAFDRFLTLRGAGVPPLCEGEKIAEFRGGGKDGRPITIERNLGSYFLPEFWTLRNLGENLVLEEVSASCMEELIRRGAGGERYTSG